jgi:hypothetical protein
VLFVQHLAGVNFEIALYPQQGFGKCSDEALSEPYNILCAWGVGKL